jgi:hypothetical protein
VVKRSDGTETTVGGGLSSQAEPLRLSNDGLAVVYELGSIVALLAEIANALNRIDRHLMDQKPLMPYG